MCIFFNFVPIKEVHFQYLSKLPANFCGHTNDRHDFSLNVMVQNIAQSLIRIYTELNSSIKKCIIQLSKPLLGVSFHASSYKGNIEGKTDIARSLFLCH